MRFQTRLVAAVALLPEPKENGFRFDRRAHEGARSVLDIDIEPTPRCTAGHKLSDSARRKCGRNCPALPGKMEVKLNKFLVLILAINCVT